MTSRRQRPVETHAEPACFEPLESRTLLDGDVTAFVSDTGDLIVKGDRSGNQIVIDQTGLAGDQLRITSGDGTTTINGQAGPVVLSGIDRHVLIKMGKGDDTVTVNTVDLPGSMMIHGGHGDNIVDVDGALLAERLTVKNGRGNHTVTVEGDSVILGDMKIIHGRGNAQITLDHVDILRNLLIKTSGDQIHSFQTVTIVGDTRVFNGNGGIALTAAETIASGDLTIRTRKGFDSVNILGDCGVGGTAFVDIGAGGGNVQLAGLYGDIRVKATKGMARIGLRGPTVAGSVRIDTGTGADLITVDDPDIAGNMVIRTGKNDDVVEIEASGFAGGSGGTLGGNVWISTSSGDDTLTIGVAGEAGNSADFQAGAVFDGGKGDDTIDWQTNGNTFAETPTLNGFETNG